MNSSEVKVAVNTRQKDTVFRILFRDKKNLLQLYNALNDSQYEDEEQLEIVTLERSKAVKIPAPRFIVFYNGTEKRPEREWLKLSDLYEISESHPMLELQVLMLNINADNNKELKEKCSCLAEYMLYVDRIRMYATECHTLQEAVERAIESCILDGILKEFLQTHKAEAMTVSIFEYDEEKELRLYREAEREVGIEQGIELGVELGIEQTLSLIVGKKLKKNKGLEQIAEELEEDIEVLRPIYEKLCRENNKEK